MSHAPFAYTAHAVWRYFLVAHERYFGDFFLVNQKLTRNPTLSAKNKNPCKSMICKGFFFATHCRVTSAGRISECFRLTNKKGPLTRAFLIGGSHGIKMRRPRRPSACQRTIAGILLLNFQPGIRYCMAMASSRAPRPCCRYNWCARCTASMSSSTPKPGFLGTSTYPR